MKKLAMMGKSVLTVLLLLAILVVVNLISAGQFFRIDLTENNYYTVSEATKDILEELDDVVNIKVYFSGDLPPQLINLDTEVRDLLDEYKAYAANNLEVSFINPDDDEELKRKLRFMGIPELRVNVLEKDRAELTMIYLGIAVTYEDRQEVIPVVRSTANLEYDLTSAILKVTRDDTPVIGFYRGPLHEEGDYGTLRQELRKQYEVMPVELSEGSSIPDKVSTLIVAGPENMSDYTEFSIDQFIMKGGKTVFLVDMVSTPERTLAVEPIDTGIDEFLSNFNIKVRDNLLLDGKSADMASFRTRMGFLTVNYPFWIKVTPSGFNTESPIVSKLESMVIPWCSSVEFMGPEDGDYEVTALVKTTDGAWHQEGNYRINPQQRYSPPGGETDIYDLALVVKGSFDSKFKAENPPEIEGLGASKETMEKSPETHIAVVGDSDFLTEQFLGRSEGNLVFMLNLVDWMSLGDKLIEIRSRKSTDRPLSETTDSERAFIKFASIFTVPLLLALFGIGRRLVQRKSKRDYELLRRGGR